MDEDSDIVDYEVSGQMWRVNDGPAFLKFFEVHRAMIPKIHFWAEHSDHLALAWKICRLTYGIQPIFPSPETAHLDIYDQILSVDEIATEIKGDRDEVKMEMSSIKASWKVFVRNMPAEEVQAPQEDVVLPTFAAPDPRKFDVDESPIRNDEMQVLKYRGFFKHHFDSLDRGEEEVNAEMRMVYTRVLELARVFEEPMAKDIARQAVINELILSRIDNELLGMDVKGAKFNTLRETKHKIEQTILSQWKQIEEICPFVKTAINKATAIGAISDIILGHMEWNRDKTHNVVDGMFTEFEIATELRASQQLPPHYRPGWVMATLEARAGIFDPNYRRKIPIAVCKAYDMAFQIAAKAIVERYNIKLPDLLKNGPDGEYPDIPLAESAEMINSPQDAETDRPGVDVELAESVDSVPLDDGMINGQQPN